MVILHFKALIFCANFDTCPVKNNWTNGMIQAALRDPESETNKYLKYHELRNELIADPQGFELWQIEARNNLEYQGRKLLRELKKEFRLE